MKHTMFTASKIRDGEGFLDNHLVANDYFNENESVSGEWLGKGAAMLGIEGNSIDAGDKTFARFRRNRLPDGSKMTPRDTDSRVRFIGFQCSAPKGFSICAVTAGDARLIEAHRESVAFAVCEMESFAACQENTLTERKNRITGNLTVARFTHTASRELDPQVHDHLILVAATHLGEKEGWRALTEYEIFKAVRYLGKVYSNELARRCRELGYEIRPDYDNRRRVKGFEIEGISKETLELFSKRRAQVERGIEWFKRKHGREPTTAEIQVMVNQTRDSKLAEVSTPEVIRRQRAQLDPQTLENLDALKFRAMRLAGAERVPPAFNREKDSLREAISHKYERDCVVSGHELLAEALNQDLGNLNLVALKRTLSGPELIGMGDSDDARRNLYVTPAGLRRERWILHVAKEAKGSFRPLAEVSEVAEKLSEEQRRAVKKLLGCRDRFAILRGAAGVGKTTVLSEVDRHLRDHGSHVVYCAPTASAAETLRDDGLCGATTLSAFLVSAEREAPPPGTVLVVDESGLASHKDGAAVMRVALKHECRVIFVGDTKQHSSVEAGDFLRLIETKCAPHRVELLEIRRQTVPAYRSAIAQMAVGSPKAGLARLDAMGAVKESGPEYLERAAESYVKAAQAGENTLCVTPTWAENHALTGAIRRHLRDSGQLGDGVMIQVHEPLSWTGAEKADTVRYTPGLKVIFDRRHVGFSSGDTATVVAVKNGAVTVRSDAGVSANLPLKRGGFEVCSTRDIEVAAGDVLILRANDRVRGLINGTRLIVDSIEAGKIRTRDGVMLNPDEFGRFTHGYVVTSHKSQGKTCDRVIVAAARLDGKAAYVACSRGRTSCELHTPDKRELFASVPTGDRPLVAEQFGFSEKASVTSPPTPARDRLEWFRGPWETILQHTRRWFREKEPELSREQDA